MSSKIPTHFPHLEVEVAVHHKLAGVGARHGGALTSSEQAQRPDVDGCLAVGLCGEGW